MSSLRLVPVFLITAAACTGQIAGDGVPLDDDNPPGQGGQRPGSSKPGSTTTPGGSGGMTMGGGGSGVVASGDIGPVATTRFARLSHEEWENTVQDLLRLPARSGLSSTFERDAVLGFDNEGAALSVTESLRVGYEAAAEQLAASVVSSPEQLAAVAGPTATDTGDITSRGLAFVRAFGRRAYRRPLDMTEEQAYAALFAKGASLFPGADPFKAGVQLTLQAFLQAPSFLYKGELGTKVERGRIALSDYELATKLSYALTSSMPDDQLLDAAGRGTLSKPESLAAEAKRLLATPRARAAMDHFTFQWLTLTQYDRMMKDTKVFPTFNAALVNDIRQESVLFMRHIFESGAGLHDILTAPYTFATKRLAAVYGATASSDSEASKVDLDPKQRMGLLTQVGFLASHAGSVESDIIHRGVFVNRDVLCFSVPAPPENVPPLPESDAKTNRARVEMFTGRGTCGEGCHSTFINPPGYAFEHYDALGRYRTEENGMAIDATGAYPFSTGRATFNNALELIKQVAAAPEAHECYARQLLAFSHGRAPVDGDKPLLAALSKRSLADKASTRDLLVDLVTSPAFTTRLP